MPRNTITAIWAAGIVLALFVYLTGPDRFVYAAFDFLQRTWWALQDTLRNISIAAFDLVRALAIGLYFVFVALAVLAIRRDGRGVAALVAVTLVFLLLVWELVRQRLRRPHALDGGAADQHGGRAHHDPPAHPTARLAVASGRHAAAAGTITPRQRRQCRHRIGNSSVIQSTTVAVAGVAIPCCRRTHAGGRAACRPPPPARRCPARTARSTR